MAILTENTKAQQYELSKPWNHMDGKVLDAIMNKDEKTFRQCILEMIRADRKGYDLNLIALDFAAYAYLRFAKNCGLEIKPIHAFEVLFGNLEISIDKSQWKLPYEDEILQILNG